MSEQRPTPEPVPARPRDPWFWSHYESAAGIVVSELPADRFERGRKVLDFGCGDGATALGVASRAKADVVGVDLYESFNQLPGICEKELGTAALPSNISFHRVIENEPLPFADGTFDLVYSWSVFEHLADVRSVLRELRRVTAARGLLFIQIEPLFHGPFGSHLQRLVDEPWAHLLDDEEEFLRRAGSAEDHVPPGEQDVLYRTHAFEDVKRHLIGEYRKLNRITAEELCRLVDESGFRRISTKLIKEEKLEPDDQLLERFPLELLLANQVVLVAQSAD